MDERKLVKKLLEERFKAGVLRCTACGRMGVPNSYFVNIRHPVIRGLWEAWKKENGVLYAASDEERMRFEVNLLNEEARRALAAWVKEADNEKE